MPSNGYSTSQDNISYRDEDWKKWAYSRMEQQDKEIACLKADKRLVAERLRYIVASVPVEETDAELIAIASALEQNKWIDE